jgi:hypothetical protein
MRSLINDQEHNIVHRHLIELKHCFYFRSSHVTKPCHKTLIHNNRGCTVVFWLGRTRGVRGAYCSSSTRSSLSGARGVLGSAVPMAWMIVGLSGLAAGRNTDEVIIIIIVVSGTLAPNMSPSITGEPVATWTTTTRHYRFMS